MKFAKIKTLVLNYPERYTLFKELDDAGYVCKNYYTVNHLKKLLNLGFNDSEIKKFLKNYIEASLKIRTTHTKDIYVFLYGEIIGEKLYNDYIKNISIGSKKAYQNGKKAAFEHFFPEYYIKQGFTEEEAIKKVNERKLKAKEKSKEAIAAGKRKTSTNIEYYIDKGLTLDEAKETLHKRQSITGLKSFQARYGDEEGLKRFNERNRKWQNTLNNKSQDEKDRIYKLRVAGFAKAHREKYVSAKEIEILDCLEKNLNIKIERQFSILYNNKIYLYDGKYNNVLIEFNGDYWHCNPQKFNENYFHPQKNMTAKEIWEFDNFKNNIVAKDYKVFVIWEDELNDKNAIIERFKLYL